MLRCKISSQKPNSTMSSALAWPVSGRSVNGLNSRWRPHWASRLNATKSMKADRLCRTTLSRDSRLPWIVTLNTYSQGKARRAPEEGRVHYTELVQTVNVPTFLIFRSDVADAGFLGEFELHASPATGDLISCESAGRHLMLRVRAIIHDARLKGERSVLGHASRIYAVVEPSCPYP